MTVRQLHHTLPLVLLQLAMARPKAAKRKTVAKPSRRTLMDGRWFKILLLHHHGHVAKFHRISLLNQKVVFGRRLSGEYVTPD